MIWDIKNTATPEELWKMTLGYLAVELSVERSGVLLRSLGTHPFELVANRQLHPDHLWDGSVIDLKLLYQVDRIGQAKSTTLGGRSIFCAPLLEPTDDPGATTTGGESVLGIIYADRPLSEDEFSQAELEQVQTFLASVAVRWQQLQPPVPKKASTGLPSGRLRRGAEPSAEPLALTVGAAIPAPAVAAIAPDARVSSASGQKRSLMSTRILSKPDLVAGRFMLSNPILECRFSTLYESFDRLNNSLIVLRKLAVSTNGDANSSREVRQQTLREGRHLSRLIHRNLPHVQEVVEDAGQVYLVLEEFSGSTLADAVKPGQPDQRGTLVKLEPYKKVDIAEGTGYGIASELIERYLEQLLDVLAYLHGQDPPIIHRDLRPDNILVTPHGVLKIAEFGLARMRDSKVDSRETSFRSEGSPYYAPPEQLMGEPSRPSQDLYAVGCLLYYLASGRPPFRSIERYGGSVVQPSLSELRQDLSPALVQMIERLMSPMADERPANAEAAQIMWRQTPQLVVEPDEEEEEEEEVPEPPASISPAPTVQSEQVLIFQPTVETAEKAPVVYKDKRPGSGSLTPVSKRATTRSSPLASLAQKFSAWNFLLPKKPKVELPVFIADEPAIIEFRSDLASGGEIDLTQVNLSVTLGKLLTETVAKAIQGVVIAQPAPDEITVAVKDPSEVHIYDHISVSTEGRYKPTLVAAEPRYIDLAMDYIYRSNQFTEVIPWSEWLDRKTFETEDLQVANPMADVSYGVDEITSPIIAAVDKMIKEAISTGASDIHMETYETGMDVRYRIDGQLHVINHHPISESSAMVKRLKVMANMDIAQERITQGGRISLKVGGQELDLRVSIVPVPHGESVVMRLLKKGAFHLTLRDLGFSEPTMVQFGEILSQPYGMILVCGPTGSGKSTTLYASLKQIQRPDRKLLTVEDPIEYQMPGICQVQVNNTPKEEEQKVSFARVLREFLRQDPDVILVGEIRDTETAAIAVQAALTGHLLLSTIHTNDSVGIIARLTDMSVEPFLIGSTLLGGLAQRLARKICSKCREEVPVSDELKRIFEVEDITTPPRMFKGIGCKACHHTGHRGRVGLYELLEINADVRNLINRRALEEEIRKTVAAQRFRNLYYDGLTKVSEGLVSLEEVQRVCKTI